MICVADFHDLCPRLCRKVGVMEFGLYACRVSIQRAAVNGGKYVKDASKVLDKDNYVICTIK